MRKNREYRIRLLLNLLDNDGLTTEAEKMFIDYLKYEMEQASLQRQKEVEVQKNYLSVASGDK